MAILGKGPGPKKKDQPKSKIGGGTGRTVAAPGYAMGLIRNQRDIKTPTKSVTMGSGPAAVTRTQQQGIIGPKPTGPGQKVPVSRAQKKADSLAQKIAKKGYSYERGGPRKSAVGGLLSDAKDSISYAVGQVGYNLRPSVQKRGTFKSRGGGGRRGGGKTCPAYWNY
jgi:hypothetical protein